MVEQGFRPDWDFPRFFANATSLVAAAVGLCLDCDCKSTEKEPRCQQLAAARVRLSGSITLADGLKLPVISQ